MIRATVSSQSCFCWVYSASPSLAAKNIINLISVLTIWWCPCVECSLVLLEEVFAMTSAFSWQNSISLCLASFSIPHSICQQICKTQQWPQEYKSLVFIPIPKKGNAKEHSSYCTIALILHASKVTLKILQGRFQQYMNLEPPDVQAGFRKGRGKWR